MQVTFLPRSRWISRNTVSPACCSVSAGRPLGQKKQTGSYNERRELQTLSWRERIKRGCHATEIKRHCTKAGLSSCVLDGPLTESQVDSWYIIVGAALPAVRNSPFCDGGLLNHLNEAMMDAGIDWTHTLPCDSCSVVSASSILSEVACVSVFTQNSEENRKKKQCQVFGSPMVWGACENLEDLVLTFSAEPPLPQNILLHDGEPLYQQQLIACVVFSLQTLNSGDALLLPVFSALTRVTAAVVLCLHVCFDSVTFRCPPPSGVIGTVLMCVGFCPETAAQILPVLTEVHGSMGQLLGGEVDSGENLQSGFNRQVLQFVPMEELLAGGLTDFLWTMNSEIIQQRLHSLMQS